MQKATTSSQLLSSNDSFRVLDHC